MQNKKFLKVFGLGAVALLGLTACGSVTAKPSTYNDALIDTTSYSEKIYNNTARVVFDAIQKGGIGSDVLNEILYLYSVTEFGPYNATVKAAGVEVAEGEITLSEAVTSEEKLASFIKAHKVYWDDSRKESGDTAAAISNSEKERVKAKVQTINDRIAEKMYAKISTGSYSDRHIFSEAKFLSDLKKNLKSVRDPEVGTENLYTGQILPGVEAKDVFKEGGFLNLSNYMDEANTYIVDEIVPEIYRELLNELYVVEENYNTLGRSSARKVNIIEIKNNDKYPSASYYLANALVKELNSTESAPTDVLKRFKEYSAAYIGTSNNSTTQAILNAAKPSAGSADADIFKAFGNDEDITGVYYGATEYGDLAQKYVKMLESKSVDTSAENSFTNSSSYPSYVGLGLQKMDLEEKDYVTSGWFIKNGGLTELPSSIRDRLFNISVASGVKESEEDQQAASRKCTDGVWSEAANENAYVCRINGHNYLKKADRVKGDSIEKDILHYDASSKSYYIIEIEEAVSSSKLNVESNYNYVHLRNASVMENIINEVNKLVAQDSSYSSLATKKYLEAMSIAYHDDSVYNYFLSTYPELFD